MKSSKALQPSITAYHCQCALCKCVYFALKSTPCLTLSKTSRSDLILSQDLGTASPDDLANTRLWVSPTSAVIQVIEASLAAKHHVHSVVTLTLAHCHTPGSSAKSSVVNTSCVPLHGMGRVSRQREGKLHL